MLYLHDFSRFVSMPTSEAFRLLKYVGWIVHSQNLNSYYSKTASFFPGIAQAYYSKMPGLVKSTSLLQLAQRYKNWQLATTLRRFWLCS